jgi:hypothetical protein
LTVPPYFYILWLRKMMPPNIMGLN